MRHAWLTAFAACGGGSAKTSADELGRAVLAAVADRDREALVALMPSLDLVVDACAANEGTHALDVKRARAESKLIASFSECGEKDWSKLEVTHIAGGGPSHHATCPSGLEDIIVHGMLDGFDAKIAIRDPVTIGGRLYLFDEIECSAPWPEGFVRIVATAENDVCACANAACAREAVEPLRGQLADAKRAIPIAPRQIAGWIQRSLDGLGACLVPFGMTL